MGKAEDRVQSAKCRMQNVKMGDVAGWRSGCSLPGELSSVIQFFLQDAQVGGRGRNGMGEREVCDVAEVGSVRLLYGPGEPFGAPRVQMNPDRAACSPSDVTNGAARHRHFT
jgi:hypothetical protein